ncbi:MAG TPA: hypothetical protein VM431_12695 [Phycisphaerae bacterium]|nr:hypothetical protein [Phycisphaerae bacterium]
MTFSQRERLILIAAVVVLGALVLDWFALTPLLDRRAEVTAAKDLLLGKMQKAETVLQRRRTLGARWQRMRTEGLKPDPGEAESQVLHALGKWAAETGLNLVSIRPERSNQETPLPEINLRAAGTGSMAAVSRFLWRLETAEIPVKIKTLQLASRKEGLDDLSLQLDLSTLYVTDRPPAKPDAWNPAAPKGDEP